MKSIRGPIPYPGTLSKECLLELPAKTQVVKLMLGIRPSKLIESSGPRKGRPLSIDMVAALVVFGDLTALAVPRRFILVRGEELVPDHATYVASASSQLPDGRILNVHLLELQSDLVIPQTAPPQGKTIL